MTTAKNTANPKPANPTLRTEAWLLTGVTVGKQDLEIPGYLELKAGVLSFTVDTSLGFTLADASDGARLFRIPIADVQNITFPWYYASFGFKFQSGGTNYRINLAGPTLTNWAKAAQNGKRWKAILST